MKTTHLGTIEGIPPVAFHGGTQQVATVYVGKLNLNQHVRAYQIGKLTSFIKFPGSYSSQLDFIPSGKMLVVTETYPGGPIEGNWRIRGYMCICDYKEKGEIMFRAEMNYGGGAQGSKFVTVSPRGGLMALSDNYDRNTVYVVDLASTCTHPAIGEKTSTEFSTLCTLKDPGLSSETKALKWSPSGDFIAKVGCQYNSIELVLWKLSRNDSGSSLIDVYGSIPLNETITGKEPSPSEKIAFSPDSSLIAVAGSKTVPLRFVDVQSKQIAYETPYDTALVTALSFSENGNHLLTGDADGNLSMWLLHKEGEKISLQLVDRVRSSGAILEIAPAVQGMPALAAVKKDGKHIDIERIDL